MTMRPDNLLLEDQLCFALYAATNAVVRAYRPLLADLGVTYPQYLVMLVLWQEAPLKLREVAERLKLSPSAVSPLIDRLEQNGFVNRKATADRRVTQIALTPEGKALELSASRVQQQVVCRSNLDGDSLCNLRDELHRFLDDFEQRDRPNAA